MKGIVMIGSKRRRGIPGEKDPIVPSFINIDATSGSANKVTDESGNKFNVKTAFSPMYLNGFTYCGQPVANFESFWQYGKIFKELGHIQDGEITQKFYDFRNYGWKLLKGERHPKGTRTDEVIHHENGKNKYRYLSAVASCYDLDGTQLDYIQSRKVVYSHVYSYLVQRTHQFQILKLQIEKGKKIQILDIDGPRDGSHEVTVELLRRKINDKSAPFGHGYVLAGLLRGIKPEDYCDYTENDRILLDNLNEF